MNVEIVEFYPFGRDEEKDILSGTLRIKLPDIGVHILGVYVSKKKKLWFFNLPMRRGTHHETGKPVNYPTIVFEDSEKQRCLMEAIREKGRAFIEKRINDQENPIKWPEKREQVKPQPTQKEPPNAKETVSIAKTPPTEETKPKPPRAVQWQDPPPRKQAFVRSKSELAHR